MLQLCLREIPQIHKASTNILIPRKETLRILEHDAVDIVVNEATLNQWHWLIGSHGKGRLRNMNANRLVTAFDPQFYVTGRVSFRYTIIDDSRQ